MKLERLNERIGKRYFYGRVSTKDQNLDRQLASARAYKEIDHVFMDKKSGKDFEREEYQKMKSILEPGDEVVFHALDRLGRNKEGVKQELAWFREHGVVVRILNIPTTLIEYPAGQEWVMDMVNNIIIEVLAAMAEQEREEMLERQAEGIAAMPVDENGKKISRKTGRGFGREKKDVDLTLRAGETVKDACSRLDISRQTYYRKIREMGVRA